jgi:hypothetical protein
MTANRTPQGDVDTVSEAVDGATANAMGLLDLARWIGEARQAISNLNVMAGYDPVLADRLREAAIYVGDCDWDEHETFGLQRLHLCMRDELRAARAALNLKGEPL